MLRRPAEHSSLWLDYSLPLQLTQLCIIVDHLRTFSIINYFTVNRVSFSSLSCLPLSAWCIGITGRELSCVADRKEAATLLRRNVTAKQSYQHQYRQLYLPFTVSASSCTDKRPYMLTSCAVYLLTVENLSACPSLAAVPV